MELNPSPRSFVLVAFAAGILDSGCDVSPDGCGAAPGVPCEPYCPGSATDEYDDVFVGDESLLPFPTTAQSSRSFYEELDDPIDLADAAEGRFVW